LKNYTRGKYSCFFHFFP